MKTIAMTLGVALGLTVALPSGWGQSGATGTTGSSSALPQSQPKIELIAPAYDFGTALEGEVVKHTFRLRNVGKGQLVIGGVTTSCGCTAAQPTKSVLAPGEEAEITASFDTRFEKDHQVRSITVHTNDPQNPNPVMTIEGNVRQQVAATPAQVAFGKVRRGTEATREVLISELTGKNDFRVESVTNSNHAIRVAQARRADGQPGALLRVSLLKSMPVGPFDDTVKVTTSRVPVLIDVFGTVTGDLDVEPAQVSFGIVRHGGGSVHIIRLTNQGPKAVRVLDISSNNVGVTASAEPVSAGKEYKIMVSLHPGTPDGQVRGQLQIKTDDPNQPTLNVPFYGIVGQFKL